MSGRMLSINHGVEGLGLRATQRARRASISTGLAVAVQNIPKCMAVRTRALTLCVEEGPRYPISMKFPETYNESPSTKIPDMLKVRVYTFNPKYTI